MEDSPAGVAVKETKEWRLRQQDRQVRWWVLFLFVGDRLCSGYKMEAPLCGSDRSTLFIFFSFCVCFVHVLFADLSV